MKTNLSLLQKKTLVLLMIGFALSACASQAHEKEAALLPVDSTQARAEIIELISQSFGGKKIPIAKNIFRALKQLPKTKASRVCSSTGKALSENFPLGAKNTKPAKMFMIPSCLKR